MQFAKQLERLVRILPGVSGYQDREAARDTDKAVRLRVAAEIELLKRNLEEEKEKQVERKELSLLPALDRAASKLDKLGNLTRYASRGYSAFFDADPVDQKTLAQLYAFDLGLFDELELIWNEIKQIGQSSMDADAFKAAMKNFNRLLDGFEKTFSARQGIFTKK
jgi:hypothetical protein